MRSAPQRNNESKSRSFIAPFARNFVDELESLADHFFTFLPQRFGGAGVQRIGANTFAGGGDGCAFWDNFSDVAILAVLTANFFRRSNDAGPD